MVFQEPELPAGWNRVPGYGRVICPAAWRAAQFGRTSTCLDPQAEQRNPPHTSGNGVSAAERGSRAATGMVVLWWQSKHETDSSPGSARVGRAVIFQVLHSLRHHGPLLRVAVIPGGRSGLARHRF